jgi:pyrimidine oxygenase
MAKAEYDQMGLWPGDDHYLKRYDMLGEYAQILRDLWETGRSDFKGDYFEMTDCRVSPRPQAEMKIICAGSSDEGLAFAAAHADYAFCLARASTRRRPLPGSTTGWPPRRQRRGGMSRLSS